MYRHLKVQYSKYVYSTHTHPTAYVLLPVNLYGIHWRNISYTSTYMHSGWLKYNLYYYTLYIHIHTFICNKIWWTCCRVILPVEVRDAANVFGSSSFGDRLLFRCVLFFRVWVSSVSVLPWLSTMHESREPPRGTQNSNLDPDSLASRSRRHLSLSICTCKIKTNF